MNRRLRVYLVGPISKGDLAHNIGQAEAAFYRLMKAGFAPWCPQWSCYGSGPKITPSGSVYAIAATTHLGMGHDDWLGVDLPWVECADAILRLPGESTGADTEVAHATARGIPVFTSEVDLMRWAQE